MSTTRFHDGWAFARTPEGDAVSVALPHDAMIGEQRAADAATEGHGGFFPGGTYRYIKTWRVPADAATTRYSLLFEGVQGDTRVLLDGREVAANRNGYREFTAPLTGVRPGAEAVIEVLVDMVAVPTDRWYSGAGIYRPVWLEAQGPVRIARDGLRFVTTAAAEDAEVDVFIDAEGIGEGGAVAVVELSLDGAVILQAEAPIPATGHGEIRFTVPAAQLWSAESPTLYDVKVALVSDGVTGDERSLRLGLRTISIDPQHGLRINGHTVLLRGAAVHHDNGILGAATYATAEHRRARALKDAGYNAIRSAHNPLSRHFLDACDELGLYVMDELTDVWFARKTAGDGSARFRDEWRDDVDSMIAKDRNRPSVIMYSIGNEIAEAATAEGAALARDIHAYVYASDPTRPTTLAVNPLLAMMSTKAAAANAKAAAKTGADAGAENAPPERREATSTAANLITAKLGRLMVGASLLPAADHATRDAFAAVDVAGYNYAYASYPGARKRYPNRVILGTESMPGDLPAIWKRVTKVPGVIGDFNWTGWDYLGEVGLGYWSYGSEVGGISKPFPGILAGAGVFDITGHPGALLSLAQAVWQTTDTPGIAVRPLDKAGQRANRTPWLSTDAMPSWSWGALRGTADVEVYSHGDHVELLLNGRTLGRKRAGVKKSFVARFRTPYEPGELTAVAYRNGAEIGRSTLRSASEVAVQLRAEQSTGGDELSFVQVGLGDTDGTIDSATTDVITLAIEGPGEIAGFGTARPITEERFTSPTQTTYRGRALAAIRRTADVGDIVVTARSTHHGEATVVLSPALAATH
ncbi:glycoside hydrolase family 2 TIM barrel-domain containing protein [Microbacterium hominis]|uniref:Glycoside hydrolase family 2 protein n=1 Tax=Microbacterium hominis TaxID=162426 RepID=A0A7D4UH41_9MICO|nr:glycoside hydrolase family 2 TIM barrel-domain containing protein [Microbacterium hominis]QKJ20509.1 glycoside hydrolase family 2 protein [Microbacterium hominis]